MDINEFFGEFFEDDSSDIFRKSYDDSVREDSYILDEETGVLSAVTYTGDYAIYTYINMIYVAAPFLEDMVRGSGRTPNTFSTMVVEVGDGALASAANKGPAMSTRFVQGYDTAEKMVSGHDMIVEAVKAGSLDLDRTVSEAELFPI
jgi:hypothetical protein